MAVADLRLTKVKAASYAFQTSHHTVFAPVDQATPALHYTVTVEFLVFFQRFWRGKPHHAKPMPICIFLPSPFVVSLNSLEALLFPLVAALRLRYALRILVVFQPHLLIYVRSGLMRYQLLIQQRLERREYCVASGFSGVIKVTVMATSYLHTFTPWPILL